MARATIIFLVLLVGVAVNSEDGVTGQWHDIIDTDLDGGVSSSSLSSWEDGGEFGTFSEKVLSRRRRSLDWNVIVDNLLAQARENVIAEGKDELPIPNIDERFEKRFGFIKMTGRFEATDGRVRSVASIRRTGDVSFTGVPGQSVTLTAHLGFGELFLKYHTYKARIWHMGPRGHISARIGSNSVRLRLRLNVAETTCSVTIEEATVLDVSGFDVRVTGLGPLNWLTSKIVTWVARKRRDDIMRNLERAMRRGLDRAIERFKCDKYINDLRGFTG